MPKIEVRKNDIKKLLKKEFNDDALENILETAKAEIDEIQDDTYKIELNDTNRPDLWSSAGLARHINQYLNLQEYNYTFHSKTDYEIKVDKNIHKIRPYIAGFGVKNIKVDEELLLELIQNQEKFAMNFGRKRADIAIGIYKLDRIKFPVIYKAIKPSDIKFTPLSEDKEMDLNQILEKHPKGIEFGHIVKEYSEYPIITDSENNVLSFPPIINSKFIGEVEVGDKELFVELTGRNFTNILLVANIIACDLSDRGAEIIPVKVSFSYDTDYSKSVNVPYSFNNSMKVDISKFDKLTGFEPNTKEIKSCLLKMGYKNIKFDKNELSVSIPDFRNDIMHMVDIVEDFIIGKGYNNSPVKMPSDPTIGILSKEEIFSDHLRDWAIGMGFQEVLSNILTSEDNIYIKMNNDTGNALEIKNPMSESYNVLRNSIIPSLLEVESISAKADYPHHIFEIGEIVNKDNNENHGFRTAMNIGLLSAHPKANFSEMRSYIDNFLYYSGIDKFDINSFEAAFLLNGRSAQVTHKNKILGYFGEIHPEILEKWDINMPCAVIELFAGMLRMLLTGD